MLAKEDSLVVTSKSGIRTVEPRKILNSSAGREGIRRTRELFVRLSQEENPDIAKERGATELEQ